MNVTAVGQTTATAGTLDPSTMTPEQLARYEALMDLVQETFGILVLSMTSGNGNPAGWTGWQWRENERN